MITEVKFELMEGISRQQVPELLRNKYPNMKVISLRVDINKQDLPKELRKDFIQSTKVYFIPDVDKLIKQVDKEIELK